MENVRNAITSANQNFMDAFKRADAAAIAALYTADATLLPPDAQMMNGTEAIKSFWQGAMNMGIKEARLETMKVEAQGDLAYEIGRYTLSIETKGGEGMAIAGKYVVVWKQQGGAWKLHADIWNSDAPA